MPLTSPPASTARWSVKPVPDDALERLASSDLASEIPSPLLRILAQRGFHDPAAARSFLFPKLADLADPFLIPDMAPAVDRLFQAIDQNQSVVLYGDYDVDGVTSLTLLTTILRAYGLHPHPFLPNRIDEGYGISREGLERCFDSLKPDLLVAVDCGTTSHNELAWLHSQGVSTIVIDHHEPSPEGRPATVHALVNPKAQPGSPFSYLCTAGLAFKVAHALLKSRRLPDFDLKNYLDIAAVGTVADIVPLIGENRILVRHGMKRLESTSNPGLAALKTISGVTNPIGSSHIGFRIGPRLNAAGRLDSAQASLDLLLGDEPSQIRTLSELLDSQNRQRQSLEKRILDEAVASLPAPGGHPDTPAGIVTASRSWHPGVVGIVASRLMRTHHRPTFVIAIDEDGLGKGSGRSIPGVPLVAAIEHCRDLLLKGGGHEMAAGISIEEQNIPAFRERFAQFVAGLAASTPDLLTPHIAADAEISFADIGFALADHNDLLEPVGAENPQPLFLTRGVTPDSEPRELKEKHLKLTLRHGRETREAIFFNQRIHDLPPPPWDIAYRVERNSYRDHISIQIQIQHLRSTPQ